MTYREKMIYALETVPVHDGVIRMSEEVRDKIVELLKKPESNHGNCKDCMNASEDCTGTFWCAAYDIPVTPEFYCTYFEEK